MKSASYASYRAAGALPEDEPDEYPTSTGDCRDFYCHDCHDWRSCTADEETPGSTWSCGLCGAGIKCDVCGESWTLEHVCGGGR